MTKTAGDLLREARNKKGLALQTIERSTGIATHNLLAIELDQFALIDPDKLEQYLRTYAQAVDISYDSLGLSALGTPQAVEVPSVEAPKPVSSFDDLVKSEDPDYTPKAVTPTSLRRSGRTTHTVKPPKKKSVLGPILTLLSLAAVIAVAFIFFKDDIAKLLPSKATTASSSTAVSTSSSSVAPATSQPAPTPETQLTVTGGGDAIDVAVVTDQKPVKIELSLSGEGQSWVGLSNSDLGEGGTTLSSEQPTYLATVADDATQAILYIGITEGITIKVNGQVLDLSAITTTANSAVTFNIQ